MEMRTCLLEDYERTVDDGRPNGSFEECLLLIILLSCI